MAAQQAASPGIERDLDRLGQRAVALRVLAMLAARTDQARYRDRANATLGSFSSDVAARPMAYPYLLLGADDLHQGESGALENRWR